MAFKWSPGGCKCCGFQVIVGLVPDQTDTRFRIVRSNFKGDTTEANDNWIYRFPDQAEGPYHTIAPAFWGITPKHTYWYWPIVTGPGQTSEGRIFKIATEDATEVYSILQSSLSPDPLPPFSFPRPHWLTDGLCIFYFPVSRPYPQLRKSYIAVVREDGSALFPYRASKAGTYHYPLGVRTLFCTNTQLMASLPESYELDDPITDTETIDPEYFRNWGSYSPTYYGRISLVSSASTLTLHSRAGPVDLLIDDENEYYSTDPPSVGSCSVPIEWTEAVALDVGGSILPGDTLGSYGGGTGELGAGVAVMPDASYHVVTGKPDFSPRSGYQLFGKEGHRGVYHRSNSVFHGSSFASNNDLTEDLWYRFGGALRSFRVTSIAGEDQEGVGGLEVLGEDSYYTWNLPGPLSGTISPALSQVQIDAQLFHGPVDMDFDAAESHPYHDGVIPPGWHETGFYGKSKFRSLFLPAGTSEHYYDGTVKTFYESRTGNSLALTPDPPHENFTLTTTAKLAGDLEILTPALYYIWPFGVAFATMNGWSEYAAVEAEIQGTEDTCNYFNDDLTRRLVKINYTQFQVSLLDGNKVNVYPPFPVFIPLADGLT